MEDGIKFSQKNISRDSNVTGEARNKETSIVSKKNTKPASLRISKTTPIDIEDVILMITAIPFDHTVSIRSRGNTRERGAVDINGIMNVEGEASKRPLFVIKAH